MDDMFGKGNKQPRVGRPHHHHHHVPSSCPSQVLMEWHPSDASAHVILSPWATVFDARSFENLLLRCIVPQLVQALRSLAILPHNQDLQPLEWVFTWADLLSPLHFLALLEGELFPKWLQTLYSWLQSPTADFSEVGR